MEKIKSKTAQETNGSSAEDPVEPSADEGSLKTRDRITIRFAGDSGDGMQLAGNRFTDATAIYGNDFSTLPDFPAEIRAPAGSLAGVSSFQVSFSRLNIHTPGDTPDALVAMNPAALRVHLNDLTPNGVLIINSDAFSTVNLRKAGYTKNPLDDNSLKGYRVVSAKITTATTAAAENLGISQQEAERTKNLYALGLVSWMFDRNLNPTLEWISKRFAKTPKIVEANQRALKAGYAFGETIEIADSHLSVPPAQLHPGQYRSVTGNDATAIGLVAASKLTGRDLFYASYPITPASDILHQLATYRNFGVLTFQAEDEIAAIGSVVGAAFGGALGVTGTSGPGVALKSEGIGLAVMTELPLIVIDVQRSGPSTGMPTKTEQGDLLQVMFGRNSESPVAVVAPSGPGDCFYMAIEAARIAFKYMTPVIFLSDSYLANTAEPWMIPDMRTLKPFPVHFETDPKKYKPYGRDPETLARQYAVPGTPGLQHRIGGLEKSDGTGDVSYNPENHQRMTELRAERIERIANDIPEIEVDGPQEGGILVLGWGSTYGVILTAVDSARALGIDVSVAHLRYLNPFPRNLGNVLSRFKKIIVPENNLGQLRMLLRAKYLVDAEGINKITGQPFSSNEITETIIKVNNQE